MQRLSSVVKEKVEAYVVSGVQEERKIELLDNLSIAVEKIQSKFENPIHNKVVKDGKEVENLCSCLEDIFQHGIREKILQSSVNAIENPSFWPVIQKLSMKEDIQSIYRLSIIQTDVNRCRAWIRMKVKDHTIGSYIGLLTENSKLLKEHYNSNAFLRDPVKTESVKTLLQYVIASLDFYINVDTPRRSYDEPSIDARISPGLSSPDSDLSRVDPSNIQRGEIINRRRSSKKRAKIPIASIAQIREFDSVSSFSSEHSSGRSSRGSSVASPLSENLNLNTEVKIKLLEGSFTDTEKSDVANLKMEHVEENVDDKVDGSGFEMEAHGRVGMNEGLEERKIMEKLKSERWERSESSSSSRSRSSNESTRDLGSSLSREGSIAPASRKEGETISSAKKRGFLEMGESSSSSSSSSPGRKTSVPLSDVINQEQKDEIEVMMRDLKLKSNKPLTTDKLLEIIQIQKGMSVDEIKSYINECLKSYFTMGIITTKGVTSNLVKSPSIKPSDRESPSQSESQKETVVGQSKVETESERKKSIEEFVRRGRTGPPYWSNVSSGNKKIGIDVRTDKNEAVELSGAIAKEEEIKNNLKEKSCKEIIEQPSVLPMRIVPSSGMERGFSGTEKNLITAQEDKVNGSSATKENKTNEIENANVKVMDERIGTVDPVKDNLTVYDSAVIGESFPFNSHEDVLMNEKGNENGNERKDLGAETVHGNVEVMKQLGDEFSEGHKKVDDAMIQFELDKNDAENQVIHNESFEDEAKVNLQIKGGNSDDTSTPLEASNEMNFVPGICEEESKGAQSTAKPITRLRKANTVGPAMTRRTSSPKNKMTRSLERETLGKLKSKSSSSGDPGDLLYGFKMNSPTIADSTTSSIDTNQGYMFDDDDYVTDSEGDTYTSGENNEKERIRSLLADLGVNDDIIGMKEDHFSTPDSFMGFTSDEELENAIETCKERVQSLAADSEERKHLVKKLVQLRLKRHEQREAPSDDVINVRKILGHQFAKEGKVNGNYFCDSCGSTIWALVHTLYKCTDCSFHCHRKCLKSVDKSCVSKKVSGTIYITEIAPESGLATQQYRCADCRRRLIFRDGYFHSRTCDYTGQFYCSNCHWNEVQVIPARVVHNWDFVPRKVSRQSKHLLNLLSLKPIICLKEINPALFNFVEDLRDVRALREQILEMKKYLASCRIAMQDKLLLLLQDRQHFVENSHMYTMQDLININNGRLLEELSSLTATFGKHIKFDCPICQGRGFICELCPSSDVIFPFDFNSVTCLECHSLFHRSCYRKGNCPKCKRIAARGVQSTLHDR